MANDAAIAICQDTLRTAKRTGRRGHEDLIKIRKSRKRRQHPDYRVRLVIHLEDLTDHVRIARKTLLPEVVAEDEHRGRALFVFPWLKRATKQWFYPEDIKEVVRNHSGLYTFRVRPAEKDEPH